MIDEDTLKTAVDSMILSASGWRGVFASDGDEESVSEQISEAHRLVCAAAAFTFAGYLSNKSEKPVVLLGTDTRPTGNVIVKTMIPALLDCGCDVRYAGVIAAPEIMAWARTFANAPCAGFIYISASHNPIGHNGIKFGLTDGGVLAPEEMEKLIGKFKEFFTNAKSNQKFRREEQEGIKNCICRK